MFATQNVTRIPLDAQEAGWRGDAALFRMEESFTTPFGEDFVHVVASTVSDEDGTETALFAASEEGHMAFPIPVAVVEGDDVKALLAKVNLTDVTEG